MHDDGLMNKEETDAAVAQVVKDYIGWLASNRTSSVPSDSRAASVSRKRTARSLAAPASTSSSSSSEPTPKKKLRITRRGGLGEGGDSPRSRSKLLSASRNSAGGTPATKSGSRNGQPDTLREIREKVQTIKNTLHVLQSGKAVNVVCMPLIHSGLTNGRTFPTRFLSRTAARLSCGLLVTISVRFVRSFPSEPLFLILNVMLFAGVFYRLGHRCSRLQGESSISEKAARTQPDPNPP